jgi:pyrimidine deaminase RibD-like protein
VSNSAAIERGFAVSIVRGDVSPPVVVDDNEVVDEDCAESEGEVHAAAAAAGCLEWACRAT